MQSRRKIVGPDRRNRVRESAATKSAATGKKVDRPRVLDAVEDQDGSHWVKFGTSSKSFWFSLRELQTNEREVFGRISAPNMTFLTPKSRHFFKELIESHADYRPALVARHPGWTGSSYIFGDGSQICSHQDTREAIITFDTNPKFTPKGKLCEWQSGIEPVVRNQPLALFVLAYAFVGPLLRFAPRGILNPQVEIVGERESGKSTLAALAASVWAGDPTNDAGGGENWDLTVNALDRYKLAHADNLLMLDESNLGGTDARGQQELAGKAVFKIAAKGGRKRFTDTMTAPNINVALLSTSNIPLMDQVRARGAVRGAQESRMITVLIPKAHPYGVLEFVPPDFSTARAAMEHLRSAVDDSYGVAGRAFIKRLVEAAANDEVALRRRIETLMSRFLKNLGGKRSLSARVEKVLALTRAAGILARQWGIIPKEWGPLSRAIMRVLKLRATSEAPGTAELALEQIERYAHKYRTEMIKVSELKCPLSRKSFDNTAGFIRSVQRRKEILIPSRRFQSEFPDYLKLVRDLKLLGVAHTEGGRQPKFTIKTPTAVCAEGRVYCIRLPNGQFRKRRDGSS